MGPGLLQARGPREKRRFFAVRSDVADSFTQMAAKKSLTMYGSVTDILREVVRLDNQGFSIYDASVALQQSKTAREAGFVNVPEILWYEMVESSVKRDRGGTIAKFSDAGKWLGRYVLAKSQGVDLPKHFMESLAPLTHDCTEFLVENRDGLSIRCFNPSHSQSYAEAFSALLVEMAASIGFECRNMGYSNGVIVLSFDKKQEPLPTARGK